MSGVHAVRIDEHEAEELPLLWQGDVLVAGGGSAGSSAAVAAARAGARTLVVDSRGYLGGTGASVLDTFYGFFAPGRPDTRVVGGIAWEVCERLFADGQAFLRENSYGAGTGVTYEPDHLRLVWDDLTESAGAWALLHALVTAVVMRGERVVGVVVATRSGPRLLLARVVVDATGDADVSWRAGAAIQMSDGERRLQPLTTTFRVGFVGAGTPVPAELRELMGHAANGGGYALPRTDGSTHPTTLPGVVHTNLTRMSGVDATDPWDLSAAEREGRRQTLEYARFLIEQVPGYADARVLSVTTPIGVRETRRLVGEYVLCREDVMSARDFPDAIARCGAPLEDHDAGDGTRWEYIGDGDRPTGATYGIPYRCLLPAAVDGLLVAGRCLSATHDAHASVRSMAQCMAMGQAAGRAAALSADTATRPRDLDVEGLCTALADDGVFL